jgi:flagellar basal-body rod protein FlgG
MYQPLYVAATGMNALEEELTDITNNLANAKTVAFKKGRTELESLFSIQKGFQTQLSEAILRREAFGSPVGVEFGTGVRVSATPKDFSQGTIEITKNPLDLAISGDGFLQFRMPDGGLGYGRAGNLHIDNEGNMVDAAGHLLEPQITLPENTTGVGINSAGKILVSISGQTAQEEIGQIELARFVNPAGLQSIGQNLYAATVASGDAVIGNPADEGYGTIVQFALEQSNVDVISEMMRMIMTQRVFDTVTKAVSSYDGMLTALERMKQ